MISHWQHLYQFHYDVYDITFSLVPLQVSMDVSHIEEILLYAQQTNLRKWDPLHLMPRQVHFEIWDPSEDQILNSWWALKVKMNTSYSAKEKLTGIFF